MRNEVVGRLAQSVVATLCLGLARSYVLKPLLLPQVFHDYSIGKFVTNRYGTSSNQYKAYNVVYSTVVFQSLKHLLDKYATTSAVGLCENNIAKYGAELGVNVCYNSLFYMTKFSDNTEKKTYSLDRSKIQSYITKSVIPNCIANLILEHSTRSSNLAGVLVANAIYLGLDCGGRGSTIGGLLPMLTSDNNVCFAKAMLCSATAICLMYSPVKDQKLVCNFLLSVVRNFINEFKFDEVVAGYMNTTSF